MPNPTPDADDAMSEDDCPYCGGCEEITATMANGKTDFIPCPHPCHRALAASERDAAREAGEGRWSFNAESRDIELANAPVFRVYEADDFPCIEDEDRAKEDEWFDAQAQTAVLMLNSLLHATGDATPVHSPEPPATKPDHLHDGEWFYPEGDHSSEKCRFSPDEVIDYALEGENVTRVVAIERAAALPTVYAAVHVYSDAEKDARGSDDDYDYTLFSTVDEARAALSVVPATKPDRMSLREVMNGPDNREATKPDRLDYESALFDVLEALKPRFPKMAGGFARGTGGVDLPYVLSLLKPDTAVFTPTQKGEDDPRHWRSRIDDSTARLGRIEAGDVLSEVYEGKDAEKQAYELRTDLGVLRAGYRALSATAVTDQSAGERVTEVDWTVQRILQDVCELPDRSSPDDEPDMVLVTVDELDAIVRAALTDPMGSVTETVDIPEGMVPWAGGDSAPDDWAGGAVMLRDGRYLYKQMQPLSWGRPFGEHDGDIIAYTPKPSSPVSCMEKGS